MYSHTKGGGSEAKMGKADKDDEVKSMPIMDFFLST